MDDTTAEDLFSFGCGCLYFTLVLLSITALVLFVVWLFQQVF